MRPGSPWLVAKPRPARSAPRHSSPVRTSGGPRDFDKNFSFYARSIRPGLTAAGQRSWFTTGGRRSARSRSPIRQIVYGAGSLIALLVGAVALTVGSQIFGPNILTGRAPPRGQQLTAHVASRSPDPSAAARPLTATASPAITATAAAPQPPATAPAPAAPSPKPPPAPALSLASAEGALPVVPMHSTIASWYGQRPRGCYERGRHLALPAGLTMWIASPTLSCGTTVKLSGPEGTVIVQVEDHGPYLHPGRELDLSPEVFRRVAGSLSRGLAPVSYGLAPGAAPSR